MDIAERTLQLKEDFDKVYEAGKKAEHTEFWDKYQNYGKRTDYAYAFFSQTAYSQWGAVTFKPKYDIRPKNANRLCTCMKGIEDLTEHLKECGVILDTSNAKNCSLMFQNGGFKRLPVIDFSSMTECSGAFAYMGSLETIDKLIIADNGSPFSSTFLGSIKLKNITVEGVIGQTISFSNCPLSVDSMKSIITALKQFDTYTYTLTLKASAFAELEAEGATAEYNGVACTWRELIDNKKWNLTLSQGG